MLAEHATPSSCGLFQEDVQLPDTARQELLDFIASELPRWRDHPDRPSATSETDLTDQLCTYLTGAARHSAGWSRLQFRTEVTDEVEKGRKIDLAIKPCAVTVWVEGRRHTQFQTLVPIECKRLPTPKGTDRDEREYVFSSFSSTGGIQRFKSAHHGGEHRLAGMIAYVQSGTLADWHRQVSAWINDLVKAKTPDWSSEDLLEAVAEDEATSVAQYRSLHVRTGRKPLPDLELRHLWVLMR